MMGLVKVVSPEEFDAWLAGEAVPGVAAGAAPANPLVTQGKQLYLSKACAGCHSLNGTPGSGPTFKGLFGRSEKLVGGATAQVDENYIRESILNPNAKTVQGFAAGVMPPYAGQLSEDEITSIIEFLKTIK
jgi:cytochrome c oxidase subunit 2